MATLMFAGESFRQFARIALPGPDLHRPGGVDAEADFGSAEADEIVEDFRLAAERVAAVAMDADADAELLRPAPHPGHGLHEILDAKVAGNMARAGKGGEFEPGLFVVVALA